MDIDLLKEYRALEDCPGRVRILDRLVRDNMALVDKLTRKYTAYTTVVFEAEDVHQAGVIGLIKGIRGFDTERGTRFSTYAAFWIRREIQAHLEKCIPIHRPAQAGMPYKSLRKGEAATARSGAAPTADELEVSEEQLEKWQAVIFHFVPMDEARDDDTEGASLGSRGSHFQSPEPTAEEDLIEQERMEKATRALSSLSPVERRILIDNDTKGLPAGFVEATRDAAILRLRAFLESS